ncbi:MAG: hypothetical protein IJW16_03415 [Clostridia bacterium]|nr:hypothetical protein [Clostridia bacterium]
MLAVIDSRAPQWLEDGLKRYGHTALRLPMHPALPRPVSAHPDMNLFFAKDRILCTEEYRRIAARELDQLSKAADRPIVTVTEKVGDRYPDDILLNAAPVGSFLFCNEAHTASEVTEGYTVLAVRQGYAKCSVVPVSRNSLITADPSIASTAERAELEVLSISQASISLPGYDTGFLGGASTLSPYTNIPEIYFCGNIASHPDGDAIIAFCERHGKRAISLADKPLIDVGTVFLI